MFFAYDCKAGKVLYSGPDGPARYMILAKSTGRVYWTPGKEDAVGRLVRWDPAVGGASFLVPASMPGVSAVVRVAHHPVANAVGAAIAQVSGEVDQIFQDLPRDEAIARARIGKAESAAKLLQPLVERELPRYLQAAQLWNQTYEIRSKALWQRLQVGHAADQSFIRYVNSLPPDKAQVEVQNWINHQLQNDAQLNGIRRQIEELADVRTAAHELAMIELALARDAAPGPAKSAWLASAERLFRDLRRASPDDTDQEMRLAQVCVWLGKDAEAKEIFDRLEKSEDAHVLHQVGDIYRDLGRDDAARALLEKAWARAGPDHKSGIAVTRALTTS